MAKLFLLKDQQAVPLDHFPFTGEDNERGLQELIERHPDILPAEEMGARRFFVIGFENHAIDLLLIDETGMVTVVETKLASNPEIAREVIGQGLEYAAKLVAEATAQSLEETARDYWRERQKGDFDIVLQEVFGDNAGQLWQSAEQRLRRGEIRVVVAADRIPQELRLVVEMLKGKFDFHVADISRMRGKERVFASVQGDRPEQADGNSDFMDQTNVVKWLSEALHVCVVHLRRWKHDDETYIGAKVTEDARPRKRRLQAMTREEFFERTPPWSRGTLSDLVGYWEKDCGQSLYFESVSAVLRATIDGGQVSIGYLIPSTDKKVPEIQFYVRGTPKLEDKWAKEFETAAEELHLGEWTKTRMTLKIPIGKDFTTESVDAVKRVLGMFARTAPRSGS